ncbi:MAG: hypothetical protein EB124_11925 [Betaproteobacteria bacterium]|nr:hypothetical protein [Betaproteobacteria bacterium]
MTTKTTIDIGATYIAHNGEVYKFDDKYAIIGGRFSRTRYTAPKGTKSTEHYQNTIKPDIIALYDLEIKPFFPKGMRFSVSVSRENEGRGKTIKISLSNIPYKSGSNEWDIIKQSLNNIAKEHNYHTNSSDIMTDYFKSWDKFNFKISMKEATKIPNNPAIPKLYLGKGEIQYHQMGPYTETAKRTELQIAEVKAGQQRYYARKAWIDALPPPPAEWLN